MPLTKASAHGTADPAAYNELAGYFNGEAGYPANPLKLITYNSASDPVLTLKNLDQTVGQCFEFYKYDGTLLASATKDGFRFSSDGSNAGLVPVSISGIETITGAKVFGSKVTWHRATSTPSATALTLPTDGNLVPITGTTPITSIAATGLSGSVMMLEFASVGCQVTASSTLQLDGSFVSGAAKATLTLACDGVNWIELARKRGATQGIAIPAAGQTMTSSFAVVTLGTATYDRYGVKSGNTFVVPWTGVWRVHGTMECAMSSFGYRQMAVFKAGAQLSLVAQVQGPDASADGGSSFSLPLSLTAGDVIDFRVKSSSTNLALRAATVLAMDYLGLP